MKVTFVQAEFDDDSQAPALLEMLRPLLLVGGAEARNGNEGPEARNGNGGNDGTNGKPIVATREVLVSGRLEPLVPRTDVVYEGEPLLGKVVGPSPSGTLKQDPKLAAGTIGPTAGPDTTAGMPYSRPADSRLHRHKVTKNKNAVLPTVSSKAMNAAENPLDGKKVIDRIRDLLRAKGPKTSGEIYNALLQAGVLTSSNAVYNIVYRLVKLGEAVCNDGDNRYSMVVA